MSGLGDLPGQHHSLPEQLAPAPPRHEKQQVDIRVARWFIFIPKIPIWINYWRALEWKVFVYFMTIRNILRPFGIVFGRLVLFVVIR
jgi:hypothetical protein